MKKSIVLILAVLMMVAFVGGCSNNKGKDVIKVVEIKAVHEKIKEEFGEDYIPNMELDLEALENFIGLNPDDIDVFIAENPMISVNVDTFIAIKAKEGKGDSVNTSLEDYRTNLVENSMQYPMNLAKVNASKVVRHGDYVFFLMIGKYDEREEASEEERLDFAKEEIKRAEDIINGFFE